MSKVLDVDDCARCGQAHDGLAFKPLTNPIESSLFESLTHWAMCPELDQPILLGHRELSQFVGCISSKVNA